MEYIIVRFPRSRRVYIDGDESGRTGMRLRVEEGTHTINLGEPRGLHAKVATPDGHRNDRPPAQTVELLSSNMKEWTRDQEMLEQCQSLIEATCPAARLPAGELPTIEFYPIEVTFSAVSDPTWRKFFNGIGTNYALTPEEIDRLIELGPELLEQSSVFRALRKALQ